MSRRTALALNTEQETTPEASEAAPDPFKAAAVALADRGDALLQALGPAQRKRVQAMVQRAKERASGPPMKLSFKDNTLRITYVHPDPDAAALLIMADLGTADPAFFDGISSQVAKLGAQGAKIDETNSNFLLSVVRAVAPRDELETMLAVQMGAIHTATMMMARRLNHIENIPQQDAAERALNKLARTFATQLDALKRYRTGGQQRVIVEHVTVNEGGQAIVGHVETGGGNRGVGAQ